MITAEGATIAPLLDRQHGGNIATFATMVKRPSPSSPQPPPPLSESGNVDEHSKTSAVTVSRRGEAAGAGVSSTTGESICDCPKLTQQDCNNNSTISFYVFVTICTCLLTRFSSILKLTPATVKLVIVVCLVAVVATREVEAYASEFDKTEHLRDNLEQSIAAVFNKVAYGGSTTKRSIPDNAYPVTTLATPLLTTYRYSDGNDEWLRVDVKNSDNNRQSGRSSVDFETEYDNKDDSGGYGVDLEKDHVLPTSAPAADILKNNNNKHYNNPNRYNNDRLRPDFQDNNQEQVTENIYKTTTSYNLLRNVRPTKSMYSKDIPSYVPPSRAFFTPPLPPEYQNPFADKPTLRGTNSEGFANRRPLPPPSLMPNKDRIPFRPDLPKVNVEKTAAGAAAPPPPIVDRSNEQARPPSNDKNEKKKTLNTPSHNVRLGEFYGIRNLNESSFEPYEKNYSPGSSIDRILGGPNGRRDEIPDILYRAVTAIPNVQRSEPKTTKIRTPSVEPSLKVEKKIEEEGDDEVAVAAKNDEVEVVAKKEIVQDSRPPESVTVKKEVVSVEKKEDTTTQISDMVNLPNVKEKEANVTKASSEEIWLVCWNVHVYLVVFAYILLAVYSIYKLIRYENDPHMFSKSSFLTVHLMLTVICVLRIFYLVYDAYNFNKSFNIFLYDFLHSFPLSLLATTFAVLILFLLKRTLTHLEAKTRPVPAFLVVCAIGHIILCGCLSVVESFGHLDKPSLTICRPVFVLLTLALGGSYLFLYRVIKKELAKKSQHLSEMCTQNISNASHITIAVALLFILLGCVQFYALFCIKVDRFNGEIKHHWILWGFELSVRFLEITIITLLAVVVSLKMSQREKQTAGGFPLFPCTTSDSSTDNIYPTNCNTNPNALNYSRNEMIMDSIPNEPVERPNLIKSAFQNDSFDKKSTLERYQSDPERPSSNFERPMWDSDRFPSRQNVDQTSLNNFIQPSFERGAHNSSRIERNSARKTYDSAKYYTKPRYDLEFNNEDYQHDFGGGSNNQERNIYSEPVDNNHQYERTRHEFERSDLDRRSRNSSNTSGRRTRKSHARPHLGVQTLPNHDGRHQLPDTMLVEDKGYLRFKHMQEEMDKPKKLKKVTNNDISHFSDA